MDDVQRLVSRTFTLETIKFQIVELTLYVTDQVVANVVHLIGLFPIYLALISLIGFYFVT